MPVSRAQLSPRSLVAIAVLGMLLLGGGIYFGVNFAVERAVVANAEDKAHQWTDYFLSAMPGLDQLLAGAELTPAQDGIIETAQKVGDVYRFKLYSPAAKQVLVSDNEAEADEDHDAESPDRNDTAAAVLATHVPSIEVHSAVPGQPPLYVEAYVPIEDASHATHGVVEVYIDQTRTASLLRTTFAMLAIGLAVIAALAFGLPTLAFLFRSRQAREARQRVDFLAHHDTVTGLLNRATFTERLDTRLGQRGERLAVVFFDIDDFKAINETYGPAAGDEVLRHAARCIAGPTGAADIAARPGGDEFTVALAGRSGEEVVAYVEAVMAAMLEPISHTGRTISGTLSAGVYDVEPGDDLSAVMHRADVALYQAKVDGRNTFRRFSAEVETKMAARRLLETRLRDAVFNKTFELHFQPLLHAQSGRCAGFEALLRLPDGKGGLIPPAEFIPVAEAMGLINEIGAWVLGRATQVAADWPAELFVAVNLSVRQFSDGQLIDHVQAALRDSGLKPSQLELEVTESMLIDNAGPVGAQLAQIKALGVSIAMDDFGTGYSSLGYLWQFRFDKLKIDRSFVTALETDEKRAREILDTIIVLGHKLDMTITAEGIETERQARVLVTLGCDHVQGYLYGRPASASELGAFLLRNREIRPDAMPEPAHTAAG